MTTCGTSLQPAWFAESWDSGQPKRPSPELTWDRVRQAAQPHTLICSNVHTLVPKLFAFIFHVVPEDR